jgi:hypothetical protein
MKENYDNNSVRKMRIAKEIRPIIDSISNRIMMDSPSEERTYTLIELFPREFIITEKKKVIRSVTKNI